ncbi:MAG: histidine kinase [Verrucomicrobia bacterium]|nr:histidine kinase [Verrucomicrobiota bacterium]
MHRIPTIFRPALFASAWLSAVAAGFGQPFRPPEGLPPPGVRPTPRLTGNPFVRLWQAEDYEGGAASHTVLQHPKSGYVYAANGEGVLEFDGARWRLLPLPRRGAAARLALDARGAIWVGASNEIARLEPDARGVLAVRTVVAELPGGEFAYTGEAIAAPDGVWFGGGQQIVRVDGGGAVAVWETAESFGHLWRMGGAMHTSLASREIVRLEPGGRIVPVLARDAIGVPRRRPNALTVFAARERPDGGAYLLTALGPVWWRPGVGPNWRLMPEALPYFREGLAVGGIFLADGRMVFSMVRTGLVVLTPEGALERLIDRMPGVLSEHFAHLGEDAEGGLWAAGSGRIVRFDLRSRFARHGGVQVLQGRPRQLIRHEGTLYVAHTEGVSRRIDWPGFFPPVAGMLRSAEGLAVADGRLLAATGGLVEIGPEARPQIVSSLGVKSVAPARGATAGLLAGDAQGLLRFERSETGWKDPVRVAGVRGSISAILDAGHGWVWAVAGEGRIWRVDTRGGPRVEEEAARSYGEEQGVRPRPPGDRIRLFTLGEDLLATCSAWLLRYEAATDRFEPETRISGLPPTTRMGAEAVSTNEESEVRWLRLGSPDRRLMRLEADGPGRWRALELSAPILRDFPAVSLYEDRAERTLWVAGTENLVSVDLDWRPAAPAAPLVARLRRVVAGAETVWDGAAGAAPVVVGPERDAVRFEFAAPMFGADHRGRALVQYRSRLLGFESEWTPWSGEPRRDFTNLPRRTFTFQVQARDRTGRVSEEAALTLELRAPWWRTRAALAAEGLLGILVAAGLVRLRTRALQRRAAQLEAVIAARTAELAEKNGALTAQNAELARLRERDRDEKTAARLAEEKARLEVLRYQLNPHFLYNALNSIYGLVLTTPGKAATMVLRLADFCRAALTRHEDDTTTVGAEFEKITLYLEIEKVRWNDSLQVEITIDETAREWRIPPFLLQPLVENAIKYGVNTSPDLLRVRLTARVEPGDPGALVLEVANTGAWVDPATARERGNTGLGLNNLKLRLERLRPGGHALATECREGWVIVRIRLGAPASPGSRAPAAPAMAP